MATLEKIRNRAGVLVAVVIGLALLAFILGDLFSSGGSLFNQSQRELAEINGTSIAYDTYQAQIEENEALQKLLSNQMQIDEQTSLRIREQVWQDLVRTNVMTPEYKKLGIQIHPDELFDMVQGRNIHPIISQQFADPKTGLLNRDYLMAFLQNMDQDPSRKYYWLFLEREMEKDRSFSKYTNLIRKGLAITSLQTKRALADRFTQVDFNYVVANVSGVPDSLIQITNNDLKAYYNEHSHEYKQDESRDLEYVIFPINPSPEDVEVVKTWMDTAAVELAQADDPVQYVTMNSDVPSDTSYLNQDQLPEEFRDWAFGAKVGEMNGPVSDGITFKLARVANIKYMSDSVKARHILIQQIPDPPLVTAKSGKEIADSLFQLLKRHEADWASLAAKFSVDPGSKDKGGDLGWFVNGAMVSEFNDFCFNAKKNEIGLIETQYGYHIVQVTDVSEKTKKVQLAVLQRDILASETTRQGVFAQATAFAGQNATYELFNNAVTEQHLSKRNANNLLRNERNIAGLTQPREMIRWAYKANLGDVSEVFEFGDKYVVAVVSAVREEGIAPLQQIAGEIRARVQREKKIAVLNKQMAEAMEGATTLDEIAAKLGTHVENANVSFTSYTLPNAGFEPEVLGTACGAAQGVLTGPIDGNNGVFALVVNAVNNDEQVDPVMEKQRLTSTYQSRAYYEVYEALKTKAHIVDKRYKFY